MYRFDTLSCSTVLSEGYTADKTHAKTFKFNVINYTMTVKLIGRGIKTA